MKKLQAFKFELMPTADQELNTIKFAGSCRFVFNKALAWQIEAYDKDKSTPMRYAEWANMLPKWKREDQYSWLKKVPSQILQQSLKDLEKSYKNFFNKTADFPKFKNKGSKYSFRYPQHCQLDEGNARIFMPKLGFVRYRKSRKIEGEIKNITVIKKNHKWFVSIQTEIDIDEPVHSATASIGIDLGCIRFATLSDGIYVKPCNFKCHERCLKKYQRRMSRKVKFSKNWQKEKCKVQKANAKIAQVRNDYLHKLTTEIVKNNSLIIIEDLAVKKMTKSLAGTPANSGEKAKKRGLNRSILNQGWNEFARQIEYTMKWSGEKLDFFACGGSRKRSRYEKPTSILPMKQEPTETLEDIPL